MADYLEAYAEHFDLPVRTDTRVERLTRTDEGFLLETSAGPLRAGRVIVASGAYQTPRIPAFADELDPGITQLHSSRYRNAGQLLDGPVLIVGAANSGADIALESAAAGHPTWMAGRHPGQVPFRIETRRAKVLVPIVMFVFRRVLTVNTPIGRKAQAALHGHGVNLVRVKLADLDAAGVRRVGRIDGVRDGRPMTADGEVLEPRTVVWCTGFRPDYGWIELPVTNADGEIHARTRGVRRTGSVLHRPGVPVLGGVPDDPGSGSGCALLDAGDPACGNAGDQDFGRTAVATLVITPRAA